MICKICQQKPAKLPGSTCGLKCATEAHKKSDPYDAIEERLKLAVWQAKQNNGFRIGHGGKYG